MGTSLHSCVYGTLMSDLLRATARAHTGESASLIFGRRWREEQAPGFTERNNLDGENTDWVAAGQVDLGRNFGAEGRIRLEDESLEIQRLDLVVRGAVGRFSGNLRYYNVDDALQADPVNDMILIYLIQNHPNLGVDAAAISGNTSLAKLQTAQPRFVRRTYQALDLQLGAGNAAANFASAIR